MKENEKVISSKVTNKDIVIRIPKEFVINDFNEMVEGFKVKGNRKSKFIEESTQQLTEYMENNATFSEIYDELISNEDIVKEIEEY